MSGQVLRPAASAFPAMIVGSITMEIGSAFDVCIYFRDRYKCVTKLAMALSSMERMLCSPAEINMAENHP